MAYISPIELTFNRISEELNTRTEKLIMEAVFETGVKIDRDELIKALDYDRKQYEKGYEDALRALQQGYWRDSLKEAFREHASLGGDMFHLSEIEWIIDGEPVNELPEEKPE